MSTIQNSYQLLHGVYTKYNSKESTNCLGKAYWRSTLFNVLDCSICGGLSWVGSRTDIFLTEQLHYSNGDFFS